MDLEPTDIDRIYMDCALQQARLASAMGEVPVGAVLVCADRVIASDHNRCESLNDATAHAEMLVLRAAARALGDWRLEQCTLYVTLEPCPMCMGACLNARVARVVYAAPEPKAGACGSVVDLRAPRGFNHALSVSAGCRREESALLLKTFFRDLRQRRRGQ